MSIYIVCSFIRTSTVYEIYVMLSMNPLIKLKLTEFSSLYVNVKLNLTHFLINERELNESIKKVWTKFTIQTHFFFTIYFKICQSLRTRFSHSNAILRPTVTGDGSSHIISFTGSCPGLFFSWLSGWAESDLFLGLRFIISRKLHRPKFSGSVTTLFFFFNYWPVPVWLVQKSKTSWVNSFCRKYI